MSDVERVIADEPTCPYCGASYHSGDYLDLKFDGDSTADECDACGLGYKVTLCVTYEYISDPVYPTAEAKP